MIQDHLSFSEIGEELSRPPDTIKSEVNSIYRKLGASTRSQAVTRSRELGLLEGVTTRSSCHQGNGTHPARGAKVALAASGLGWALLPFHPVGATTLRAKQGRIVMA